MDFTIPDGKLARVASEVDFTGDFPAQVVSMFRQTLQIVAAVRDESDLTRFKCLDYRKMRGTGSRWQLTLTESADLVVRIQNGRQKPTVIVERIKCHGRSKP